MATTKADKPEIIAEERVDVFIPRGTANDDPNFYCSVNGVNYVMPKGKTASLPYHVAYEIKRAFAAQEAQDARSQAMAESAHKF